MTATALVQSTPEMANASASVTNGFASSSGLVGPVVVILWAVVIVGLLSAARNSDVFDRVVSAFGVAALSAYYAIHGLAAVTALAVLSAPVYLLATADGATQAAVGKYAAYALGGYVTLTVVGYLFRHRLVEPLMQNADEHGLLTEPEPEDKAEEAAD